MEHGTVIGQYRVLEKLGEGGMGAVYIAEHSLIGRKAAIKVLLPALSANQEIVQRFFNEARAATAINDAGIVQIFDFGYHTDGSAYIVMEFLEGETLDSRLRRLGRLHPHDALRIMRQAAGSLAAAHARGIIHRDLKPENIFLVLDKEVAGGERPKLLDFGIAKLTGDADSKVKTHTSAIMGTPWFMSPEQCRGAGQIDHRSDIYALGCVLFQLLTGTPPFDGEGAGDIIASHLMVPAPVPSSRVPGIAPEVDALIARCMSKKPDERYQSMDELANALGQLLGFVTSPGGLSAPMAAYRGPSPASVVPTGSPTTLSSVASQVGLAAPAVSVAAAPAKKGRGLALALGAIAIAAAAAVALIVMTGKGGSGGESAETKSATPTPQPPAVTPDPEPEPKPEPEPEPVPEPVIVKPEVVAEPEAPVVEETDPDPKKKKKKRPPKPGPTGVPCDKDGDGIPDGREC